MISMTHLTKTYRMGDDEVRALDNVSFQVKRGEFVAIVGPSGSGKSTLMNMIGLLDSPDSGTYLLDGEDVSRMSDDRLAGVRNRKIGFVFQHFNLLGNMNARENVRLPLLYRGMRVAEADRLANCMLEKVGLAGREKHRPTQLSGGQQQRVAIARALAGTPEILLADEPTGALDSRTSVEIMDMLKELNAQGQTVVLITHNPELALEANRTVTIADGVLYEEVKAV
ncbi:MAG: putative ABC transporter ATP-binding protein YknY [Paraeggerthella hongkongensis]|jgi:putative ABC transport system ATP-binding protein|uniref:ABC transporter ATP-binding protein n=1 Tax=Paraeggerthella TaxID=651554 RepID=UPI000DF78243|nr:ABC transporter ATP-binding protein [Paraeggerthella hominis]MBU5405402.1 ABC transporter ATP-binding protein [Paraeggerthella hongkongensis]MCD2432476.1 ABC transporter ATP-binding protein [Paraeggerthella hominis]RDB58275.1 macrolide ABC transporter ATP-binding protein [Paraeggerthella hongkongensis]